MSHIETAKRLRKLIETMCDSLDDKTALTGVELFQAWTSDKEYVVDDRIRYNGILYKCIQTHTSQEDWTPDVAVSLFAKVLIPDESTIPEWEQPDSTNPYMAGDKVTHNSVIWVSAIDNNVWEPGVYGWTEAI